MKRKIDMVEEMINVKRDSLEMEILTLSPYEPDYDICMAKNETLRRIYTRYSLYKKGIATMARGDRRALNVGELIEELQKYPKDMIVAKAEYLPIWGVKTKKYYMDHRDIGEDCDREVDVVLVW